LARAREASRSRRLGHGWSRARRRAGRGGGSRPLGAAPRRSSRRRRGGRGPRRGSRQRRRGRDRPWPSGAGAEIRGLTISLSTHVLDTGSGRPAAGVRVELVRERDVMSTGETDSDGRISELAAGLDAGSYALVFWPPSPFFTRVELEVELVEGHYHVPLL